MTDAELIVLEKMAPPIKLYTWLAKVFEARRAKGEEIPLVFTEWMEAWAEVWGDGVAFTDGVPDEVWEQIAEKVA
jgi:hypothetical protein